MNLEIFDCYVRNQVSHQGPTQVDNLIWHIRNALTQAEAMTGQAREALQAVQEHDEKTAVAIAENGGLTSPVLGRRRLALTANYAACVRAFRYQANLANQALAGDLLASMPQLIQFGRTENAERVKINAIVCARVLDMVPQTLDELQATMAFGGQEILEVGEKQLDFLVGALDKSDFDTMASLGVPLRIPTPVVLTPNSRFDLLQQSSAVLAAATDECDRLNHQCAAFDMAAMERENMWGTFVASKPRAEVQPLIDKSHDSLVQLQGCKTATVAAAGQLMQAISACLNCLLEAMATGSSRRDFGLPTWHSQAVELHLLAGKSTIARAFHTHRRMMRANEKPLHWPDLPQRIAASTAEAFEQIADKYRKD